MSWTVVFHPALEREFEAFTEGVQGELLAKARLLEEFGPSLGRPAADTLRKSRHPNMKELRFTPERGIWRMAFAFDPRQQAVLLVAGNKRGTRESRFYERLIRQADDRFDDHLAQLPR